MINQQRLVIWNGGGNCETPNTNLYLIIKAKEFLVGPFFIALSFDLNYTRCHRLGKNGSSWKELALVWSVPFTFLRRRFYLCSFQRHHEISLPPAPPESTRRGGDHPSRMSSHLCSWPWWMGKTRNDEFMAKVEGDKSKEVARSTARGSRCRC
jgi:hypothetical protein